MAKIIETLQEEVNLTKKNLSPVLLELLLKETLRVALILKGICCLGKQRESHKNCSLVKWPKKW